MKVPFTITLSILIIGLISLTQCTTERELNYPVDSDGYENIIRSRYDGDEDQDDDGDYEDDNDINQTMDDGGYEDENADKRDLIRGPSFIPTIDDDSATNEIDEENYDVYNNKRKFIHHPEDALKTTAGKESIAGISEIRNHIVKTNKKQQKIFKKDILTSEVGSSDKTIPEHLISMLYEWKKPSETHKQNIHRLSKKKTNIHTHTPSINTVVSNLQRMFTTLKQSSEGDNLGRPIANENDVSDALAQSDDDSNIESHPENGKATVSTKKSKGKINVLVNVNINERPARRSNLARRVDIEYPQSTITKEVDATKKSGFLSQYGALQRLKEDDPTEGESGSGDVSVDDPSNTTVSLFSGLAFPTANRVNIVRVVNGSDADTDASDDGVSETTDDNTDDDDFMTSVSGSGEGEGDDVSTVKQKPHVSTNHQAKAPQVSVQKNPSGNTDVINPYHPLAEKINSGFHKKYHPTHAYEEEAEAEKGETPDTVFASKIAADREEKENELEHNDENTEPVLLLKQKQTAEITSSIENEVSKADRQKSNSVAKTLDAETEDLASTVKTTKLKTSSASTENAGMEQLKEKATPKEIPMDSAMEKPEQETPGKTDDSNKKKDESSSETEDKPDASQTKTNVDKTNGVWDSSIKSGANEKEDEENDEILFTKSEKKSKKKKNEAKEEQKEKTKSVAKETVAKESVGKESVAKKQDANNDDKYETLEEVREKFKTWENKIEKSNDKSSKTETSEGMEHIAKVDKGDKTNENDVDDDGDKKVEKSESKIKKHSGDKKDKKDEESTTKKVDNVTAPVITEEPSKAWKEEEKMLLEKLKNPFLSENKSSKFAATAPEDDDEDDEELLKKHKQLDKDAQELAKSADKEFSSVVQKVTQSDEEKAKEAKTKQQQKELKDFNDNADKTLDSVVNEVTSRKINNPEIVLGNQNTNKEQPTAEKPPISQQLNNALNNGTGVEKNLKQLQSFKEQILNEVAKIDKMQGTDSKGGRTTQDLKQAKEVLQKDLKVVKNLESNLKKKAISKKSKKVLKKKSATKHFKKHETVGFNKHGQFDDKEIIPDSSLGFDSPKTKKLMKKIKKAAANKKHPLEEIKSLLKAEIKRLKNNKGNKYDKQLILIRGLVQQKIKAIMSNGDLDQAAFHKLAPDIKELGGLLKARISNEKKKKYHGKTKRPGHLSKQSIDVMKNSPLGGKPLFNGKKKPLHGGIGKDKQHVDQQIKKVQNELGKVDQLTSNNNNNNNNNNPTNPTNISPNQPMDLQTATQHITNAQNAFQKIQSANVTLDASRSSQMKNLLNTLNQKLGEIYSKTQNAQHGQQALQAQQSVQQQQQQINQQYPDQTQAPGQGQGQDQGNNNTNYMTMLPNNPMDMSAQSSPMYIPQTYTQGQQAQQQQPAVQDQTHQIAQGKHTLPGPDAIDLEIEAEDNKKALADDEPVDTLVENLERDITEVWSYRDMFPDADSLGLDNEKVHNTYANLGSLSGLSLRRALNRALRGEDVGLAIVGGSISKGGPFSEKGLDFVLRSYFYAVEDYWNKIIRPVTGSSMIIRDVSIGGIATDYYSYCLQNHLPDDKLTNIVLWELSANDLKRYDDSKSPKQQPLEQFTRNVLSYKAKPALIYVNFFALFDWDPDLSTHCRNFEDEGEDDVAKYYKITSLSWRNMVCPLLKSGNNPMFTRSNLFAEDNFHPSILAHAQMSYIVIDYIRTEFLKNLVKMRKSFIAEAVQRLQIPKSIYVPRPMYQGTYQWKPLCYTYMLVDNRQPNNTLEIDEENNGNFRYTVVREFKIRSDKIVGMETQNKDQFIRYRAHIPSHINGGSEPFKKLAIMTFTDDRSAQIQFDNETPKQIDSKKKFLEGTVIKTIAENVRPGEHTITVRSGNSGFLICALVLG